MKYILKTVQSLTVIYSTFTTACVFFFASGLGENRKQKCYRGISVTEETFRHLAQHWRRLTNVHVTVTVSEEGVRSLESHQYTGKEIRALRETEKAVALSV